ncbi:MAG: hypothetical protein ABIQ18_48410, partial [Umezawaea sp.]
MVKLLNELEDARVGHKRTVRGHSKWSFAHLKLGSVEAGLAPLEPRAGATWSDLDAVSADVLDGFSHAESHDSLPDRWAPEAARPARVIASHLGST